MTDINKQQFLTELTKFLTFVNDDEREQIVNEFDKIFDDCDSQEELAATLVSPLKVTVELSRVYNKDGLEATLQKCGELAGSEEFMNGESSSDDTARDIIKAIDENSFKSIDIISDDHSDESEETPKEEMPEGTDPLIEVFARDEQEQTERSTEESASPEEEAEESENKAEAGEISEEDQTVEEEQSGNDQEPESETYQIEDADENPTEIPEAEKTEEESAEQAEEQEILPEREMPEETPVQLWEETEDHSEPVGPTVRYKVKPAALILFLIFAIPLGLLAIAICLLITAAIASCAVSVLGAGALAVSLAFNTGLTVFADIIIAVGAALGCFAIGLLLVWFMIWFLICSVRACIRFIVKLARSWCCKEEIV